MGFVKYFRYPATKSTFLGILEKLAASKIISFAEWKTNDNELVTEALK